MTVAWFGVYWLSGLWGIAMVAVLISAIRLSYRIEARSDGLQNRSGVPRRAMIVHTALNWSVSRDPETQAMRRAMNLRLLIILAGFVVFWIGLWLSGGMG